MRTDTELERVAFREKLTAAEDVLLVDLFERRAAEERDERKKASHLKQAAFFAVRAFDNGAHDPEQLARFVKLLTEVQNRDPSDSFRRKLAAIRSLAAGKDAHESILKKLSRVGDAGDKSVLATNAELDEIEVDLGVPLPKSYREYLGRYAHRLVGTYEPYPAGELVSAAQEAWAGGLEEYYLPFLEDNADYFCFDTRGSIPEPAVIYRPHDGTSDETWPNFAAWVEECWLGELDD